MATKRSRVYPPYKGKYRVSNSSEYDRALIARDNITFWLSPAAIKKWDAKPAGRRGG